MKRIIGLLVAIGLSLSVAGCAPGLIDAGKFVTASIENPVTPQRLKDAEDVLTVAFAGLNAYKRVCAQGAAEVNCKGNIAKIQVYTTRIPPLLTRLRAFVKNNDQVNAIVVFNELRNLYLLARAEAAGTGIQIGAI